MSSGWVFSDLTDRMTRLRTGSVWLLVIDSLRCRNAQKHLMIFGQALKMRADGAGDLLGFFDSKEVTDDLRVMSGLTRKALNGVALFRNLTVAHYLDLLFGFGNVVERLRDRRNGTIHKLRLGIEAVIE